MGTDIDTTQDAPSDGATTYYYDDGSLFRERDGNPAEILNGDRWETWPEPTSRMSEVDEAEAALIAGDVPLDGPNAGVSAYVPEGGEGNGEGEVEAGAAAAGE